MEQKQQIQKGCLIRWIIDYKIFAAPDEAGGAVQPLEPIYRHGIVMDVRKEIRRHLWFIVLIVWLEEVGLFYI